MKKERFNVVGMTCAACQAHVEKATKGVNGVKSVSVNLLNNNMDVEYDESVCSIKDINNELQKQGYGAFSGKKEDNRIIEKKDNSLKELIISIVILLILMYVSMGNMMWGFPLPDFIDMHHNKMGFALIQFILVLPNLSKNSFKSHPLHRNSSATPTKKQPINTFNTALGSFKAPPIPTKKNKTKPTK